jgi:hypothetical protein
MSSILTSLHGVLPYLLAFWTIPFVVIAIKMMRRPTRARYEASFRNEPATDPRLDDRPWTIEDEPTILGETSVTPPPSKHGSQSKLMSRFDY